MEEISDGLKLLTWETGCKPWLCASDDDTRPVLTKVWLHKNGGWMCATDSHTLSVIKAEFPVEYRGCGIDAGFLKLATRYKKASLAFDGEWLVIGTPFGEMRSRLDRTSKPPSFERVLRCEDTAQQIGAFSVNPDLLRRCAETLGTERGKGPTVTFGENSLSPMVVTPRNDKRESFCILMPMLTDDKADIHARARLRTVAAALADPPLAPEPAPKPAKKARKPRAAMVAHSAPEAAP